MANVTHIYGNEVTDAAARGSLAPAYSASSTYAVGDLVLHDGQLYECNTAISTAEAWTAAHWTAKTVADEVSSLKGGLTTMSVEDKLLRSELPGTTQTVTFDSNNNPSTITHSASGSTIRTDVFTWASNSVTEVRTASNKQITLTTNLTTLEQTISAISEVA